MASLVKLATCRKPHGIKGGFSVYWDTPGQNQIGPGVKVYLHPDLQQPVQEEDAARWFTIKSIAYGNKVILYVEGINDRTTAENMVPFSLWIAAQDLPPLPEHTYRLADLEKCALYDEQDHYLGKVVGSFFNQTQLILTIALAGGGQQDVPFLPVYFPQVDISQYKIVARLPQEIEA
ncbi:MAG: 16S rRNA processing protein RimM [Bacteriovoracaceae bacterium]|nr:16S rRNA processing protein RimM [Bacteriovoracaceae bacterium]